jgi:hypothetical protein
MIVDIAKIFFVIGLIFLFVKLLGKRTSGSYSILYNAHKAAPALATILGFYHGITITPWSQNYVLTGWILGFTMVALLVLGAYLGFQSEWVPFDEETDSKFKILRIVKWVLTIVVIVALAAHYLII